MVSKCGQKAEKRDRFLIAYRMVSAVVEGWRLGSQCANRLEFEEDCAGDMNCGRDRRGTRWRGEGALEPHAVVQSVH